MRDLMFGLLLAAPIGLVVLVVVVILITQRISRHRRVAAQVKRNLHRARHRKPRPRRQIEPLAPGVRLLSDGSLEVRSRPNERGDMDGLTAMAALALLVLIAIGYGIYAFAWNNTTETKVCTVQEKQATSQKEGGTNYILFTKECGQLQVADSWFQGNFNSTDLYASIHEGNSYTVKTVGWRNGFFSTYPNVIEATP
jgi:hypothetical protein